ncbi:MAG: serine hydrolase domain-containing protein [Acidobacteriota bacterium]
MTLCLTALCTAFLAIATADPPRPAVDRVFDAYGEESPGCSLGIVEDGELTYSRGYGMANLEHGVALETDSIFRIASTSKQFAAFAVLLLEADGLLSLEDDVRRFIPELHATKETVRIRHLIHHTSGMRDYLTLMRLAGLRNEDYYDNDELLAMLARQRDLNFPPGTEHLYSNTGYFLLAVLVERASGSSLREFAEKRIFGPLGMTSSHFHDDPNRIVPRRAAGYAPTASGWEISQTTLPMVGDGGLFTTVRDLTKWNANFDRNELGDEALLERQLETGQLADGSDSGYAAGLSIGDYRGLPTVSHGGAFVGYRAEFLRFPEHGTTISILCNASSAQPSQLARRVADVVLDGQLQEEAGSSASIEAPKTSDPAASGTYLGPDGRLIRVAVDDGAWKLDFVGLGTFDLARSENGAAFQLEGAPFATALSFSGSQLRFTSADAGVDFNFERIEIQGLSPEARARYAGSYFCEELQTRYLLEERDGELYLRHEKPAVDLFPDPLFQLEEGTLRSGSTQIDMEGDARVDGFRLRQGRVKNLFFRREAAQ